MKTVMTIVLDEDKHRFGWRVDRCEREEQLNALSQLLILDDKYCRNDSIEGGIYIPYYFDSIVDSIVAEMKKQLEMSLYKQMVFTIKYNDHQRNEVFLRNSFISMFMDAFKITRSEASAMVSKAIECGVLWLPKKGYVSLGKKPER